MQGRKLDVTIHSPHKRVRDLRARFNQHIDHCTDCQPSMCWQGQIMWRNTCLEALMLHGKPTLPVAGV